MNILLAILKNKRNWTFLMQNTIISIASEYFSQHSFNKHLLSIYYLPSSLLACRDSDEQHAGTIPDLSEIRIYWGSSDSCQITTCERIIPNLRKRLWKKKNSVRASHKRIVNEHLGSTVGLRSKWHMGD